MLSTRWRSLFISSTSSGKRRRPGTHHQYSQVVSASNRIIRLTTPGMRSRC
ncbi:MAG TPA: hypothetical protein V6C90_12465 [Coleofasciculaceae cyanobacterium]